MDRNERSVWSAIRNAYTRENLAIWVGRSVSAQTVLENLKWLFIDRGTPKHIRSDNGPEFIAKAVQRWLAEGGQRDDLHRAWEPWKNPFIEGCNGKLRDECLNREIFRNVLEAQAIIEN